MPTGLANITGTRYQDFRSISERELYHGVPRSKPSWCYQVQRPNISQTHAAKEAVWLRNFVVEIQGKPQGLLTVLCDNQGAIALSKDNKFHSRMKHIDLRYHFIREAVDEGKINVEYIPTAKNVANVFTKALARPKFEVFIEMLGLGGIKEKRKNTELRLKA